MKLTIAIAAAILAVAGNLPYLRDIIKKRVQPHAYSWLIWSIVSAITFFGQVAKGAGVGAISTAVSEIFTIVIFFFSLRYGFKKVAKTDTIFLILALLSIIPWLITKDPTLSVIIVVSIDLLAFSPTIRKTWRYPKTETPTLYSMNVLRHILALFSLEAYNVATALHSIAMITVNSLMVAITVIHKGIKSKDGALQ